tara:strand:- start:370 stop:1464 length:1095 start_codon:yes stop_codon:yes gene_type:complete
MKKKIIFFCPSIEVGGVEKNLFKVVNYLLKKKEHVYLVTYSDNKIKKKFDKRLIIINGKINLKINLPYFLKVLVCMFNYFLYLSFKLDVKKVLISFQSNLYFILLAKVTGNKIIARSNAAPNFYLNYSIKKFIFKKIYSLADVVLVNSYEFKLLFKKILNINTHFIYNPALNKKKLKFNYNIKKKKNIISFVNVGRLTVQKNQILLLKAFNQFKELNYRLTIIGNGSEYLNLKRYIKSNKLTKKIRIIKNINNIFPYLKNNEVFILSSLYEGLPNVLIEAQMMKNFIISSDCPSGPKEILLNGKAGYIFKNNNYKDLKNKIGLYIKNRNNVKIKNKIKLGYKNLIRFDETLNCEKYYKIIKKND